MRETLESTAPPDAPPAFRWWTFGILIGYTAALFVFCGARAALLLGRERVTSELAISEEQRGHIFDVVMRVSDAPVADGPTLEIADVLPEQVPMQDLPAGVTQDIPAVQGHKFVKFDDRILIVNPSNRLVVTMIPRYKLLP